MRLHALEGPEGSTELSIVCALPHAPKKRQVVGTGDRGHRGAGGAVPARHVLSLRPAAPQDRPEPEPQKGRATHWEQSAPTGSLQ